MEAATTTVTASAEAAVIETTVSRPSGVVVAVTGEVAATAAVTTTTGPGAAAVDGPEAPIIAGVGEVATVIGAGTSYERAADPQPITAAEIGGNLEEVATKATGVATAIPTAERAAIAGTATLRCPAVGSMRAAATVGRSGMMEWMCGRRTICSSRAPCHRRVAGLLLPFFIQIAETRNLLCC